MSSPVYSRPRCLNPLSLVRAPYNILLTSNQRERIETMWNSLMKHRGLALVKAQVPAILAALESESGISPRPDWQVQRALWSEADVAILAVGPPGQPPAVVLKLPQTAEGESSLRRQCAVLDALHTELALADWRRLLPRPTCCEVGGRFCSVERALPGYDLRGYLASKAHNGANGAEEVLLAAVSSISTLHHLAMRVVVVDEALLNRWVETPVRRLAAVTRNTAALARLEREVRVALLGRTIAIGWVHGDFWAGNLLVAPDGLTITGIVDWDLAVADELASHDFLNLVLSTDQLLNGGGLGDAVRKRLRREGWTDRDRTLLAAGRFPFADDSLRRAMLLLYWLRYVTTYLDKGPRRALSGWWLNRNVDSVLDSL